MGRDAAMRGEFEGEPASERRMGDDDAFRLERVARVSADAVGEPRGEGLQAVAGVDLDAWTLLRVLGRRYSASNTAVTSTARPGTYVESARSPRRKIPCSA